MATAVAPIRLAQHSVSTPSAILWQSTLRRERLQTDQLVGLPHYLSARGTTTTSISTMRTQAIIGMDHGGTTSTLRNGSIDELYSLDFASGLRTASYAGSETARKA